LINNQQTQKNGRKNVPLSVQQQGKNEYTDDKADNSESEIQAEIIDIHALYRLRKDKQTCRLAKPLSCPQS
jgi:hypothetical protein